MRVVEPNFELVRTKKLLRSELIILLPFNTQVRRACLLKNPPSVVSGKQPVRVVALGGHIGVRIFETEL